MKALEILIQAREKINTPAKWAKGAAARSADGDCYAKSSTNRICRDRTFPLPLQEEPKPGTVVHLHLARPGLSPSQLNWTATEGMYAALNQGLLHLDEDSAAQHVAALLDANMQAVSKARANPKSK